MKTNKCKQIVTFLVSVYILGTIASVHAKELDRAPANFIPDEDFIEVPMVYEKTFYEKFHEDNEGVFAGAKRQVETWQLEEEKAMAYGTDNVGLYNVPTLEQRQNLFQRNYLRFLSRRFEKKSNQVLTNTWQEWNTDDEVDSIDKFEEHEGYIIKAQKKSGADSAKYSETKKVKVGKDKIQFDFQPRIELGMAKVQLKTPYFKVKAWVGINGDQEVQIDRKFRLTKTKLMGRYYIEQDRYLAAADQEITKRWSIRYTHDRYDEGNPNYSTMINPENNILQLRFHMGF